MHEEGFTTAMQKKKENVFGPFNKLVKAEMGPDKLRVKVYGMLYIYIH